MTQNPYNYNRVEHSKIITNKNGVTTWELNTDFLDDYNIKFIEELMASDLHYLIDYDNKSFIPLILIDMDFTEKNGINDRVKMQYTIKFDEGNDYINNIK